MTIYRMVGTQRIPYTLVLDRTLLVLSETVNTTAAVQAATPVVKQAPKPAPDEARMTMARWATEGNDNPLPDTDDLREAYFVERKALEAQHAEAGTPCPGCEVGKIINKYREILKEGKFL